MIGALSIAQDVLHAKQRAFEFRDEAGKQLASLRATKFSGGEWVAINECRGGIDKGHINEIRHFCKLFSRIGVLDNEKVRGFLDNLVIPQLTEDHMTTLETPMSRGNIEAIGA